ncbi:MAG: DUF4397 domain-containing protein [Nannocystaceae bacterium]
MEQDGTTGDPMLLAQVRMVHLGVGVPGVDVSFNRDLVDMNRTFGTATVYEPDVDVTDFSMELTGMGFMSTFMPTLQGDSLNTIVLVGDSDGRRPLQAHPLVDDPENIAEGATRVTALHAAPGLGQVDIVSSDGTMLPQDLVFGVSSGPLDLDVTTIWPDIGLDTNDDGGADFAFDTSTLVFEYQQVNLYFTDDGMGTGVALFAHFGENLMEVGRI